MFAYYDILQGNEGKVQLLSGIPPQPDRLFASRAWDSPLRSRVWVSRCATGGGVEANQLRLP